jgi:toxin ParE1/3/4
MTIVWTKTARADLRALRKFIARDSIFQADRMVSRIIERVERVAQRPGTGHPVHEFPEKPLRKIHESPYRIIYARDDSVFQVISLVHFKQRRRIS